MFFNKLLLIICMTILSLHGAHYRDSNFSNVLACSSNSDQKINRTKELKKELNAEFMQKVKINDLVSYIYYPYYGNLGHAELEVEGVCSTYKLGQYSTESLDGKVLDRRKKEGALPFYRYIISVSPMQLKNLSDRVDQKRWCTPICSLDALTELARGANYSVPFLLRLSPLISAQYLSIAKSLGSERIKKIEFYEGREFYKGQDLENKIKVCMLQECNLIAVIIGIAGFIGLLLYDVISDPQGTASMHATTNYNEDSCSAPFQE